jgi:hypothetical protein
MDARLRFYPWDLLDVVRALPDDHWFYRGFHNLARTPTREELLMRHPPFGLVRDEDYEEEMDLQSFLAKRMLRREAQMAQNVMPFHRKHLFAQILEILPRLSARPDWFVIAFVIQVTILEPSWTASSMGPAEMCLEGKTITTMPVSLALFSFWT